VLNGAGASGIETLLRSILTPNAAMEAGYRTFRVELKDGDTLDGFFVSKPPQAIILRQPNAEDRRIPLSEVKSADFTRTSLMPEGLLDNMSEEEVKDLFGFLKRLK
jgi:putative heme-binding domain-containing protein